MTAGERPIVPEGRARGQASRHIDTPVAVRVRVPVHVPRKRVLVHERRLHSPTAARHVRHSLRLQFFFARISSRTKAE